jgi:RNA polymerase sigma-70 factor (ECF subfamily)
MHYLDSVTIDEIATSYGVHRSTAARWIAEIRGRILATTRRRLRDRIAVTASEVESLIRLLWSHVELTIREVLS